MQRFVYKVSFSPILELLWEGFLFLKQRQAFCMCVYLVHIARGEELFALLMKFHGVSAVEMLCCASNCKPFKIIAGK